MGGLRLPAEPNHLASTRQPLLARLVRDEDSLTAKELAEAIMGLEPSAEDQDAVRHALLARLACEDDRWLASKLAEAIAVLNVTVADLKVHALASSSDRHAVVRRASQL